MKKVNHKISMFLVALLVVAGVMMVPAKAMAANYTYGTVKVLELTPTSVMIDLAQVYLDNQYNSATISGYNIYLTCSELGIVKNARGFYPVTKKAYSLSGLRAGLNYSIEVEPVFNLTNGSVTNDIKFANFTTPVSGVLTPDGPATTVNPSPSIGGVTPGTPVTPVDPNPAATSVGLSTPKISSAAMSLDKIVVSIRNQAATGAEFAVFNASGKKIKTQTTSLTGTSFYGVSRNQPYTVKARVYTYVNGSKVYSNWSAGKVVVPQPNLSRSNVKVKVNSITLKWSKVKKAKNYTIFMKKRNASKWKKVKTVKKNKVTITKFAGKRINHRGGNSYDICVVTNAKVKGKTYKSGKNHYYYTYMYFI